MAGDLKNAAVRERNEIIEHLLMRGSVMGGELVYGSVAHPRAEFRTEEVLREQRAVAGEEIERNRREAPDRDGC